jgi:branched-chain amino acid transport system permease protein
MLITQFLVNGFITGLAYALIALGFGLVYNTTRIFNFAHGAVYTLSAYAFYTFYVVMEWNILLAAILALAVSAMTGVLIDEFVFRPLMKRGGSMLIALLSSLGLYIVIVNVIAVAFGNENKTLSIEVQPTYTLGAVIVTRIQLIIVAVFALIFFSLLVALRKTNIGKVLRAMRDDPDLLASMGVNQWGVRRLVFALGSILSSVAAILLALDVGIDPNIGMTAMLNGAVAVIIGGIGIFEGAAIGAVTLGLLQSLIIWQTSARWADAIIFLTLIFFLLFRPRGIIGRRRRIEEVGL